MITCFEGRIITGYYENKIKAADLSKCSRALHLRQGQLTHAQLWSVQRGRPVGI